MKDDKKNPQEETQTNLRKLARKRWFYPAVYLCVAALIMSGVLWMEKGTGSNKAQNSQNPSAKQIATQPKPNNSPDAVTVNTSNHELLKWPVADQSNVTIGQKFYDSNAPEADQVAALVNYNNTYAPNTGINIVAKDKKSFDVTAALSGTVVRAEKDNLFGYVVELKHNNGVTTLYESLAAIDVKQGDRVEQGQLIGQAGTEMYNKDMGTHLHFEVRKNGVPVNPTTYWNKQTSAVSATPSESTDAQATSAQPGSIQSSTSNSNSNNNLNSTSQQSGNQDANGSGATSSDTGSSGN